MKTKAKIYSAWCKGKLTFVKAYLKANAVIRLQQIDPTVKAKDVHLSKIVNSHQSPVEDELYKNNKL